MDKKTSPKRKILPAPVTIHWEPIEASAGFRAWVKTFGCFDAAARRMLAPRGAHTGPPRARPTPRPRPWPEHDFKDAHKAGSTR